MEQANPDALRDTDRTARDCNRWGGIHARPYGKEIGDFQGGKFMEEAYKNYEQEAEEALKEEFNLWLEGMHPDYNRTGGVLYNTPTGPQSCASLNQPIRRVLRRDKSGDADNVGKEMSDWKHTPWGTAQLTHLPGVRDYLRDGVEAARDEELAMNMLAEHGPHDLESAWMYFKHWVKKRPLSMASYIQGEGGVLLDPFSTPPSGGVARFQGAARTTKRLPRPEDISPAGNLVPGSMRQLRD